MIREHQVASCEPSRRILIHLATHLPAGTGVAIVEKAAVACDVPSGKGLTRAQVRQPRAQFAHLSARDALVRISGRCSYQQGQPAGIVGSPRPTSGPPIRQAQAISLLPPWPPVRSFRRPRGTGGYGGLCQAFGSRRVRTGWFVWTWAERSRAFLPETTALALDHYGGS